MEKINFAWFWIRHVAIFVDILILFLIGFVLWLALWALWIIPNYESVTWIISWLIVDLIWFFYFVCFHYKKWQTPWKMAVWVKVVNKNFEKISLLQSLWRVVSTILPMFIPLFVIWICALLKFDLLIPSFVSILVMLIVYMLWYSWAWWDSKKRAFHDFVAQTYVVEENPISKKWVIFWNVLIFILWLLSIFLIVGLFYYIIANPEVLMQLDPELLWELWEMWL